METQQKLELVVRVMEATALELMCLGEQHSCIYTAAVLLEVFKAQGFEGGYPLTVKPLILNPAFAERVRIERFPSDAETHSRWAQEGCSMISMGVGEVQSNEGQWFGHLVVVLPNFFEERHAICDASITQASKPEWNINLVPVFARVPDSFVEGKTEYKAPVNNSLIVYRAFPQDHSFDTAPVWRNQAYRDLAVKNIRERLASEHSIVDTSSLLSKEP